MKGTNRIELSNGTVKEIFQAWADATFGAGKVRVTSIQNDYSGTTLALKDGAEAPDEEELRDAA